MEKKNNQNKKEKKEECPFCNISEETIKRLKEAAKDKKNRGKVSKKQ